MACARNETWTVKLKLKGGASYLHNAIARCNEPKLVYYDICGYYSRIVRWVCKKNKIFLREFRPKIFGIGPCKQRCHVFHFQQYFFSNYTLCNFTSSSIVKWTIERDRLSVFLILTRNCRFNSLSKMVKYNLK